MRGIGGNLGKDSTASIYKKIRGLATFSRRCQSPSFWIRSPMLYPAELRGHTRYFNRLYNVIFSDHGGSPNFSHWNPCFPD